jgi:trigger factor
MGAWREGRAPELPDALFEEQAARRVAIGLVVREVIDQAKLQTDPARVRERIERIAEPYAEPRQVVQWYYANPEQLETVEMAVLEDQVVEHVLAAASVDVIKSSYADVMAGKHLPARPDEDHDHGHGAGHGHDHHHDHDHDHDN